MSNLDWYSGVGSADLNAHLLTACVQQLLVDITRSGLEFHWKEDVAQDLGELHPRLSEFLEKLHRNSRDEFQRLMYRIDVSETVLKAALRNHDSVKASADALATIVLKREMQKVMIREYLSGNSGASKA